MPCVWLCDCVLYARFCVQSMYGCCSMVGRVEAGSEFLGALGRLLMCGKNWYLIVCVWLCMAVYGCVLALCVWRVLFINAVASFKVPLIYFLLIFYLTLKLVQLWLWLRWGYYYVVVYWQCVRCMFCECVLCCRRVCFVWVGRLVSTDCTIVLVKVCLWRACECSVWDIAI